MAKTLGIPRSAFRTLKDRWVLLCLLLVLLLGLLNLPLPFHGDQAQFAVYARQLNDGAVLYRDLWDLKQPGIYRLYQLAGALFGMRQLSVHFLELLCFTAFSLIMVHVLKDRFRAPAFAGLAALFSVGMYYICIGPWHMTQIESLVGMPLFLYAWQLDRAIGDERIAPRPLLFAGLFAGVVLWFKWILLPMVGVMGMAAMVFAWTRGHRGFRAQLTIVSIPVLGAIVPLLLEVLWFAGHGALNELWNATFITPFQMAAEFTENRNWAWNQGRTWFKWNWGPLTILAAAGFVLRAFRLRKRLDLLTFCLMLWGSVGLWVIQAQTLSWWEYHYLLLSVPIGVLAAVGVEEIFRRSERWISGHGGLLTTAILLMVALSLFVPLRHMAHKAKLLAGHGFAFSPEDRRDFRAAVYPDYGEILSETAILDEPEYENANVYICGHPLYYHAAHRTQPVALNGYSLELYTREQLDALHQQLTAARPRLIFQDSFYNPEFIEGHSAELHRLFTREYDIIRETERGIWRERGNTNPPH